MLNVRSIDLIAGTESVMNSPRCGEPWVGFAATDASITDGGGNAYADGQVEPMQLVRDGSIQAHCLRLCLPSSTPRSGMSPTLTEAAL